jgi:DnaJ family protein C protein 2
VILALPPADPTLTEPTVLDSITMADYQKRIEWVGSAYETLKKRFANMRERQKNGASATFTDSESDEEEVKAEEKPQEDYEKKRRRRTKEDIERELLDKGDLYAILELEDKTYEARDQDIKKAYQKMALRHHPDKLGDSITEKDKEMWLKIVDAYETLLDPVKRKKYDSTLPFDDSIPSSDDFNDESFFDVFGAVFNRNARFAKKKP